MIYTLTLNTAVDYIVSIPGLIRGGVNRSAKRCFSVGGKGVNVSLALKKLGVESVAVCLCGSGFVSDEIARLLKFHGLESVIIPVNGCDSRINVKLCEPVGGSSAEAPLTGCVITEVNGNFSADKETAAAVELRLDALNQGDILIIGGSLPDGIGAGFYAEITAKAASKGVLVIADVSGEPLKAVVKNSKPFLIAPNRHELGELFGADIQRMEDAAAYGKKAGCNALVSMGEKGAVLVTADEVFSCVPAEVANGYSVGAGDALLAGFVAGYIKNKDCKSALAAGVVSASDYLRNYVV
jgi:1-phosphofructokinase